MEKLKRIVRIILFTLLIFPITYLLINLALYNYIWEYENISLTYWYMAFYYGLNAAIPNFMIAAHAAQIIIPIISIAIVIKLTRPKNTYGSARNANKHDVKKKLKLRNNKGIILGRFKGKSLRYDNSHSALVLAPPGTGKTAAIAIPNMLLVKNSVIAHDPKGELTRSTAVYRSKFSDVFIFDPAEPYSCRINLLDKSYFKFPENYEDLSLEEQREKLPDIARPRVQQVAKLLMKEEGGKDSYWKKSAASLFTCLSLWLYWYQGETNIAEIRQIASSHPKFSQTLKEMKKGIDPRKNSDGLSQKEYQELEQQLKRYEDYDPDTIPKRLQQKIAEIKDKLNQGVNNKEKKTPKKVPENVIRIINDFIQLTNSPEQLNGVRDTFLQELNIYEDPNIARATSGQSEVTIQSLRRSPQTIYIVVRDIDKARLKPLISAIIDGFALQITSEIPSKTDQRITFMLDEFIRLGNLDGIAAFPDVSRGYNANAIFIAQSFSQMEEVYGAKRSETFKTTIGYNVIFRQNDFKTAEEVSKQIGNKTIVSVSKSKSNGKTSAQLSEKAKRLYTAQNILNLKDKKSIVIVEGKPETPVFADNNYYFKNQPYKRLVKKYGFDAHTPISEVHKKLNQETS